MKTTAVVGLGNMGIGMAKNLLQAGFPVIGYDIRADRLDCLTEMGGTPARGMKDLAGADVVFVMVLNGKQALDVVRELMADLRDGATIIVTATIAPAEMRGVAEALAGSKLNLIDSPVSGGKFGAEAGTLTMMVAAADEVFAANQDVLNAVGEQIFHVGASIGLGQTVKASLQALIGVTFVGIFESLALGAKAGVKGETLYEVFGSTHLGNTPFFQGLRQADHGSAIRRYGQSYRHHVQGLRYKHGAGARKRHVSLRDQHRLRAVSSRHLAIPRRGQLVPRQVFGANFRDRSPLVISASDLCGDVKTFPVCV